MFTSRISLVSFFEHLIPAAKVAGYRLVLTSLVREADAPAYYADVKRYWSSLHDATGPDILFVFAGKRAAKALDERGIPSRRGSVALVAADAALAGDWGRRRRLRLDAAPAPSLGFDLDDLQARVLDDLRRGTPLLESDEADIATSQTLEVGDLRRYFGIREADLPCLVCILLGPLGQAVFAREVIPLSGVARTTVYTFLKTLSDALEAPFARISKLERKRIEIERLAEEQLGYVREVSHLRKTLRTAARASDSNDIREAITRILVLTGLQHRTAAERAECFQNLRWVRSQHPGQFGIVPEIQRLIDWSFAPRVVDVRFETNDETLEQHTAATTESQLLHAERAAWSDVSATLRSVVMAQAGNVDDESWDFFVAYAAPDRHIAERVFVELSLIGRVFMDTLCLKPGDRWTHEIGTAQQHAKCTVLLVTKSTPHSWFAESEYLNAIELMRAGDHRVIPVLFGEGATLPYGVEQLQAATLSEWADLERLPSLLRFVVEGA